MSRWVDLVRVRTVSGRPLSARGVTVTPQSRAVVVRWPNGGWVWHRPLAVLVEREGETERVPIVDVTRVAQLGLYALGIAFYVLAWIRRTRDRRKGNGAEG